MRWISAVILLAFSCATPRLEDLDACRLKNASGDRDATLLRDVSRLSAALPGYHPVEVGFTDLDPEGRLGSTHFDADRRTFVIELDDDLEGWQVTAVLVHEWAHYLTLGAGGPRATAHGPLWGVAYSWCFVVLHGP